MPMTTRTLSCLHPEKCGERSRSPYAVRLALVAGLAIGGALAPIGCKEREHPPETVALEGKIEKVEPSTDGGRITVSYYSEKQKQTVVGVGTVTKETEIMINGAVSTLGDLKEGDRIRGQVRVDKSGDKKTQTVLKITVDRPKPADG